MAADENIPDDVPEADALEQRRSVAPEDADAELSVGFEVPEADALDQAREVADDEPDPDGA
jgi:hypothetical protein